MGIFILVIRHRYIVFRLNIMSSILLNSASIMRARYMVHFKIWSIYNISSKPNKLPQSRRMSKIPAWFRILEHRKENGAYQSHTFKNNISVNVSPTNQFHKLHVVYQDLNKWCSVILFLHWISIDSEHIFPCVLQYSSTLWDLLNHLNNI